jgi:hypothetical protein
VQVTIQDAGGNTVVTSSAAINIAMGANPGGGALGGTLTASASSGVATFSTLWINKPGTGYTLNATSSGLTGAASTTFTITPGAASKVVFSQQPGSAVSMVALSPAIQVTVQDALGNTITTSSASITVAIAPNPGGAVLGGVLMASASGGVASFSNLTIDKAASGYTLSATSSGLTSATSNAFNITVGPATRLAFTVQPHTTPAGSNISPAVQVAVQDAGGNTVTSSTAAITVVLGNNPTNGSKLTGTSPVSAVNGVATFNDLRISKSGSGYTLIATSGVLTPVTSAGFNIT